MRVCVHWVLHVTTTTLIEIYSNDPSTVQNSCLYVGAIWVYLGAVHTHTALNEYILYIGICV